MTDPEDSDVETSESEAFELADTRSDRPDPADPADHSAAAATSAGAAIDAAPAERHPDVAELPYEQARDELVSIVARLEGGQVSLEDSMALWERGEALAAHCSRWLDGAEQRLEERSGHTG